MSSLQYISTRGGMKPQSFTEVILEGLCPDGGLAVPSSYPTLDWKTLSYQGKTGDYAQMAASVIGPFAPQINAPELLGIMQSVYTLEKFSHGQAGNQEITPLTVLEDGLGILETSNGPTLAFKDMALQLLGALFERQLSLENRQLNIIGATSGDTGSSAEYAMRGRERINVFMLSPYGRMSPFQTAQMFSLMDKNIYNLAVKGVFDDCQNIVKALSEDAPFKQKYHLGAVNSINWARIVAQVVYYFYGYAAAQKAGFRDISFVVPSGNFGNVYAGHVARQMGLPIRRLIVATNENNVLEECIRTGIYRPRLSAQVHATTSPSMDIAKSSNFERFVFDLCGRDGHKHKSLWDKLSTQGFIDFNAEGMKRAMQNDTPYDKMGLAAGANDHAGRINTIRAIWKKYGRMIDPHTADAMSVGLRLQQKGEHLIVLETAQSAKFAETIHKALSLNPTIPAAYRDIEKRPQRSTIVEAQAGAVRAYMEKHLQG